MNVRTVLDMLQNEIRSPRIHNLASAPATPVSGQLYYDTAQNILFFYNGTTWVSASGGTPPDATTSSKGIVQLAGDLAGTAASPQIAAGAVVNADIANGTIDLTTKVTGALPVGNGGTGQTTAKPARETGLAAVGVYSSATHSAGTTISITAATHGLRGSRNLNVQIFDETSGAMEIADVTVASNCDVTVTFAAYDIA